MVELDKTITLKLIFLISIIALASAFFIEHALGHQPCNLCILERIPYLMAIIIIVLNYKFIHLEKYFILLLILIFLAGFTPLPYKAFTISSGLITFNLPVFIIVSLISRSLRFFIVAYLSYKFGEYFTEFMDKHGSKWFTIIGIIIVIIFIFIYLFFKFND